jgi:hypothetical protein
MMNKKSQEEMVGFAVIIILVAVVLLVLLGFLLRSPQKEAVESYEVQSFIDSSLQYTSDCEDNLGFLAVEKLIISCEEERTCIDERNSCEVLNSTLKNIIEKAWNYGNQSAIKGYKLKIIANEQESLALSGGNETGSYKGSSETFAGRGKEYEVSLNIYS